MLDFGGDGFDSMDIKNARLLAITNLSFDEPELEVVLVDPEVNASI